LRVLFWGTPDFATPALRALLGEGFDVVGVVTQPDRPAGRGREVQPPPVKVAAREEHIAVLQPEQPRGEEFLSELREMDPDVSVVVAYGHILPREVIELPRRGTINIHASLLPLLRGAAPIQAAIREGHSQTGVSIMRMVQRLDAGPVILQLATPISQDQTYGDLALILSELGATALIEALALMELGKAREEEQDDSRATYAGKIDRESTRVDWSLDARAVSQVVRAYDPRPGAYAMLDGTDVKLFGARVAPRPDTAVIGQVLACDAQGLVVACGEGSVRLQQVQPAGKRRMNADEWLRGRGIAVGQRFQ
jgi:methionyl-tRNA formyltransferase